MGVGENDKKHDKQRFAGGRGSASEDPDWLRQPKRLRIDFTAQMTKRPR